MHLVKLQELISNLYQNFKHNKYVSEIKYQLARFRLYGEIDLDSIGLKPYRIGIRGCGTEQPSKQDVTAI